MDIQDCSCVCFSSFVLFPWLWEVFFFSLASFGFSLVQFLFNSFFLLPFWCFADFALVFHFVFLFFDLLSPFRFLLVQFGVQQVVGFDFVFILVNKCVLVLFDLICFVLSLILVWFGFAFLVDCDFGDFDLISSFMFVMAFFYDFGYDLCDFQLSFGLFCDFDYLLWQFLVLFQMKISVFNFSFVFDFHHVLV